MNTDIVAPAPADTYPDTGRTLVAVAWPTGRPIYAYTAEEIADGVDVYTRRLKAAAAEAGAADAR
ncbi:hypothetical protein [Actinoplanes sp. NPDC049316]|uniref:hypothetical protein n=1 Tax=Actinoplanes sp. NPDC049316 TaxID=3154727 RepID=UPI0034251DFD